MMTGWQKKCGATLLLVTALAGGCAPMAPRISPEVASRPVRYTLSSGDRLKITVYNEPQLSGDYAVGADGTLSYPLVGNIPLSGKTIEEAQEAVRAKLADGYVNDPRVTLEVTNFRPFYILGEVGRPGEYQYTDGLTIPQAVARAGGYSYRANQRIIFVKRAGDPVERSIDVSVSEAYVMPGDTIRVGERYF